MTPRSKSSLTQFACQAVLDGVLIRSPRYSVIVTRAGNGRMAVRSYSRSGWVRRGPWSRPYLRGFVAAGDAFLAAFEGLLESAGSGAPDSDTPSAGWSLLAVPVLALLAGASLFAATPELIRVVLPVDYASEASHWEIRALETAARLVVAALCLGGVRLSGDGRRFLRYQGAANRALTAFERGADLTVESARSMPRSHPLSGTALFISLVPIAVAVFGFALPVSAFEGLTPAPVLDHALSVGTRLLLLPLLAAATHELLRLGALRSLGAWASMEPGEAEQEVALAAMRQALRLERDLAREEDELEISAITELGALRVPAEDFRER